MIAFWFICAVLIVIALAFILPPLLEREEKSNASEVKEANIAVYRDQLRELEADRRNGIVSKEQFEQDQEEIQRRLLEDVASEKGTAKHAGPALVSRNLAYILAIALPATAIFLYLKVGTSQALSATPSVSSTPQETSTAPVADQSGEMTPQRIEANVVALEKRLEQNPNDAQGWTLLARSYSSLQRYKEASAAFEKATAVVTNDANLWADYAYALAMARGQQMEGKPAELIDKALQLDPKNPKALALAANAALKAKHYDQAIAYWQRLLRAVPDNPELTESLTEKINEAKRLAKSDANK